MKTVSDLWVKYYDRMNKNKDKAKLIASKSMTPSEYLNRAKLIAKNFKPRTIVEFGGGIGGLCNNLLKILNLKEYTIVDNPEMLNLAKENINSNITKFVEAINIESLIDKNFDLFIAEYCISETPFEYQKYILSKILPNCNSLLIRDVDKQDLILNATKHFDIDISKNKNIKLFLGNKNE